jgi:isopenicillin N synthase-like dioxygenase
VRDACEKVGFFYATGLATSQSDLDTVLNNGLGALKAFFDDSDDGSISPHKEQCASHRSPLFRGYTRCGGGNNCVPESSTPELKESFTIGAEGDTSPMHGPNLWPEQTILSGNEKDFRQDLTLCFEQMLEMSRVIAHALALSLKLDPAFFTGRMKDPAAQLVGFKYPPEHDSQTSCGEHTDCGFLTLLVQSSAGLEVCNSSGQWQSAPPVDNAILVNLGDLTQFWTGNRYKSTKHRVHNRALDNRYSVVFFANCDFDARLDVLADDTTAKDTITTTDDNGAVMTAGEYIMKKLGLMWMMDKQASGTGHCAVTL